MGGVCVFSAEKSRHIEPVGAGAGRRGGGREEVCPNRALPLAYVTDHPG